MASSVHCAREQRRPHTAPWQRPCAPHARRPCAPHARRPCAHTRATPPSGTRELPGGAPAAVLTLVRITACSFSYASIRCIASPQPAVSA
eukprot:6478714-Prymnesium_polylepis.2